jgi:hypothetical protein
MRKEEYSTKVRKALKRKVLNLAQKGKAFVFFKHEETPESAFYAEELLQAINTRCWRAGVNLSAQRGFPHLRHAPLISHFHQAVLSVITQHDFMSRLDLRACLDQGVRKLHPLPIH